MRKHKIATLAIAVAGLGEPVYAEVTATARTGYFFDDFSSGGVSSGGDVDFIVANDPFEFPMFGGSLSANFDSFTPNTRYTVSLLYGEAETSRSLLGGTTIDSLSDRVSSIRIESTAKAERVDFEFTSETRLTGFANLVLGVRYEESLISIEDSQITRRLLDEGDAQILVDNATLDDSLDWYKLYTARAGIASSIPIDDANKHRAYANLLAFAGHREVKPGGDGVPLDEASVMGPDLAVGYNYALSEDVSLDLRYRAAVFFFLSGRRDFGDAKVTHGPMISLSKRF